MVDRARNGQSDVSVYRQGEFRVADAQDLPIEDDLFDAVITDWSPPSRKT